MKSTAMIERGLVIVRSMFFYSEHVCTKVQSYLTLKNLDSNG
jgi:hypothetical protein